ncbi:hypothetical protein AA14337_3179 [Acetobacter malorum DSM 14337]|uniref:Phage protein n=2 Tax=Acetobacter malorum TaxID=178901 RepID=A0ABQ0Q032_9PROT|nr:hypothetical protein AD930_11590 [Acetobacter malorum]GBQ85859.1 hypothetical protein AA14337_3179 [Acetobacter malorum DSM 14337]
MPDDERPGMVYITEMPPYDRYGIILTTAAGEKDDYRDLPDEIRGAWKADPNGYEQIIRNRLSDAAYSLRASHPFRHYLSTRSRPMTPEEAVDAISEAFDTNRVYQPAIMPLKLNYEDLQAVAAKRNAASKDHAEQTISEYQASISEDIPALFRGLRNPLGPLPKDCRDKLLSFYNSPSLENWDNVARLIISSGRHNTPWGIWTSVDPAAPRSLNMNGDWPRTPDRDTFIKILEVASTDPKLSAAVKTVSADDILKEKLAAENALRSNMGLPVLTEVEVEEAFAETDHEPAPENDSAPTP